MALTKPGLLGGTAATGYPKYMGSKHQGVPGILRIHTFRVYPSAVGVGNSNAYAYQESKFTDWRYDPIWELCKKLS